MIPAAAPGSPRLSAPWNLGDVLVLAATNVVGAVLIAVAWFGASGTTSVRTEANWLTLGIVGAVVGGSGDGAWLLAGLRSVAVRRRGLAGRAPVGLAETLTGEMVSLVARGEPGRNDSFVAVAGLGRYHHRTCAAVSGRDVVAASADEHSTAGRRPCGLCSSRGETVDG